MSETAVRLLGLDLAGTSLAGTIAAFERRADTAAFEYVVTPNADHFIRLARVRALAPVYEQAWLRLLDSRVVARLARLLGLRSPPVVTGSDLTERLLRAHLRPGERITVVGAQDDLAPALAQRFPHLRVAHCAPPFGFERDPDHVAAVVQFVIDHPARFVFLALGSPKQEVLAARIKATGRAVGLGLCIGAGLDFATGARTRAPRWMQFAGLEWLHRLASEPKRLARRYVVDSPRILGLLLRERWFRTRP